MRASVAGLLAACALFGIPRLAGELREYRKESQRPAPIAVSAPQESQRPAPIVVSAPRESQPAAHIAPLPKAPDTAPPVKQAPVQLIALQHEPSSLAPAGAGTAPPSPAKETGLIPAIQKELTRLGLYDGPIGDKWNRAVRSAVREFFRRTGSRVHSPQPTAELLTALHAADFVKKQAAGPREGTRAEEKPAAASEAAIEETAPKQNAAGPMPAAPDEDYLPPWMIAQTDRARVVSNSKAAHSALPLDAGSRELAAAPFSASEAPKRHFHKRHRAERPWKGRRHYVSHGGYYARRRAFSPF